jgi:AcrR family transcriptional regulator
MGFLDATMEDIRVRSKASNGSIYHHFKGKNQLAAAVYLEGLSAWHEAMAKELQEHPGVLEGIYAMVRCHLRWVSEHPDWTRYLFQMRHAGIMTASEDAIAEQNRRFVQAFSQWLEPLMERGSLRRLPTELCLSLIVGPCLEISRLWLTQPDSVDLHSASNEIAKAAWQVLTTKKTG